MQDNYFDELLRTKLLSWEAPVEEPDWPAFLADWEARFDQALAEKLTGLSVPFDPADWQLFQHQLDHPLDAAVTQKLSGLQVAGALEADWADMSDQLDAPFDRLVQEKVEEVQPAPQPQDWAAMSASLLPTFDQAIHSKLSELDTDLPAEGWKALAQQLDDRPTALPRQTARLVLEGAMILLLLVVLVEKAFVRSPLEVPTDGQAVYQVAITPDTGQAPTTAASIAAITPNEVVSSAEVSNLKSTEVIAAVPPMRPVPTPKSEQAKNAPDRKSVLAPKDSATVELVRSQATNQPSQQMLATQPGPDKEALIPTKRKHPFLPSTTPKPLPLRFHSGISFRALPRSKPVQPYPSVKLGLTVTHLSTVSELNDQGKQGVALGLRSILQLSPRLSLVSGLQYAEKQFDRMVFNTYRDNTGAARQGSYWVSRLKAEFQMLEVPILLRYKFSANPRVNLYFQAGVSPMFSLSERYYDYDPRSANNLSQTLSNPQIDLSNPDNNSSLQAYLNQLEPVMQTQSINTYLGNLQFAPGIQVKIASRVSFELEPYLQVGIQRLGSAQKKMHSAGASFSLLYHLQSGSPQR